MSMLKLTPNLLVEDVNRTLKFYRDVLGFDTIMTVPVEGEYNWALMNNGGVLLMFQAQESLAEEISSHLKGKIGGSFTLYINVEDIKSLYERVREKVEIVQELYTTVYGTSEFSIRDINGYILTFSQSS
ncbi:MAG: VOC family protein [Candidatus Eremiobacteraeota bacterium]|nr:VOC family protein [Candidatus Eremiobacteraeota bacterium]